MLSRTICNIKSHNLDLTRFVVARRALHCAEKPPGAPAAPPSDALPEARVEEEGPLMSSSRSRASSLSVGCAIGCAAAERGRVKMCRKRLTRVICTGAFCQLGAKLRDWVNRQADTLGQRCPQMTRRPGTGFFFASSDPHISLIPSWSC